MINKNGVESCSRCILVKGKSAHSLLASLVMSLLCFVLGVTWINQAIAQEFGAPELVNGPLDPLEDVGALGSNFQVSPSGNEVFYSTTDGSDGSISLFRRSLVDDSVQRITSVSRIFEDRNSFIPRLDLHGFSSDGARLIYRVRLLSTSSSEVDRQDDFFSLPVAGGVPSRIVDLLANNIAGSVLVGRDRIYFASRVGSALVDTLNSVSNNGGAITVLANTPTPSGEVTFTSIRQLLESPDGNQLIYLTNSFRSSESSFIDLFTVPTDGSLAPLRLTPANLFGQVQVGVTSANMFRITNDSRRVIFTLGTDENFSADQLYSAPIAGGTPLRLDNQSLANGDISTLLLSPDSSRVVYQQRLSDTTDSSVQVFSVPVIGGTVVPLTPIIGANIQGISPDSQNLLYLSDQLTDGTTEAFVVPLTGGLPRRVNSDLTPGGDLVNTVRGHRFTPDSTRIVYQADQVTDGEVEFFVAPVSGGPIVKLGIPSSQTVGVFGISFDFTSDSNWLIYITFPTSLDDGISELFAVDLVGGAPIRLNDQLPFGSEGVGFVSIDQANQRIFYIADQNVFDQFELFSVDIPQPENEESEFFVIPIQGRGAVVVPL